MENLRVLVANEPRCYRDVVAATLGVLRPGAEVTAVEPIDIDAELSRLRPHLVVCSRLTEAVEARAGAWVLLYPEGENRAVVSVDGQRTTQPNIRFDDLLRTVDRVALLLQMQ